MIKSNSRLVTNSKKPVVRSQQKQDARKIMLSNFRKNVAEKVRKNEIYAEKSRKYSKGQSNCFLFGEHQMLT